MAPSYEDCDRRQILDKLSCKLYDPKTSLEDSMKNTLALYACCLLLLSCGTIIHGATQDIGIGSSPSNASVTIDHITHGQTPMTAKLDRDKDHTVTIKLAGYEPYSATITKSVTGWVWGNILFGGLIGLAVDAISGGLYVLSPEQVQATLMAQPKKSASVGDDAISIQVVLAPQPRWVKVGELARIGFGSRTESVQTAS
jgi:hypothetical protein